MELSDCSLHEWFFYDSSSPTRKLSVPTLPSTFHQLLWHHNLIEHPNKDQNELKQYFISLTPFWVLEMKSFISCNTLQNSFLLLQGVDTCCQVEIILQEENAEKIKPLYFENMFRIFIIPLESLFTKPSNFRLRFTFYSPILKSIEKSKQVPYDIPSPPYIHQGVTTKFRNFLRKPGCHFGWDWANAIIPSGLWNPIFFYQQNQLLFWKCIQRNHQQFQNNTCSVTLDCTLYFALPWKQEEQIICYITDAQGNRIMNITLCCSAQQSEISFSISLSQVQLWWCIPYGTPYLYQFHVQTQYQTKHFFLGIRKLELAMQQDNYGHLFQFVLNHVPIHCKGSNMIPMDHFPNRINMDYLHQFVNNVVEANQNMLRIWGGGMYLQDEFYNLCDQMGILVWHDIMFACSMYPATNEFLFEVKQEMRDQLRRLQHHCCIALWCANNENEDALQNWPEIIHSSKTHQQQLKEDYCKLVYDTVYQIIKEEKEDQMRAFMPSSPSNGLYKWNNPQDTTQGDVHFWAVWHGNKPFSFYQTITPRFCSEFGFQSLCSLETLQQFISKFDPISSNLFDKEMEYRQRSFAVGNKCILEHCVREFLMPNNWEQLIYLSQLLQSMSIKAACEHWRRSVQCSGELYWQCNDLAPFFSWSSLEYHLKWKLLQYESKRFNQPLLISAFVNNRNALDIWITHDHHQTPVNALITCDLVHFQFGTVETLQQWQIKEELITSRPLIEKLQIFETEPMDDYLFSKHKSEQTEQEVAVEKNGCNYFVVVTLQTETSFLIQTVYFEPLKRAMITVSKDMIVLQNWKWNQDTQSLSFEVTTKEPNKSVVLHLYLRCTLHLLCYDTPYQLPFYGHFDDNNFHLLPTIQESKIVTYLFSKWEIKAMESMNITNWLDIFKIQFYSNK